MSSPPLHLIPFVYDLSFLANKLGLMFVYFQDEFHIVFVCVSDILLDGRISWIPPFSLLTL